jgi:hypothetical protein
MNFSVMNIPDFPLPSFPKIPLLVKAEKTFRERLNQIYESASNLPQIDLGFNSIYQSVPQNFSSIFNSRLYSLPPRF